MLYQETQIKFAFFLILLTFTKFLKIAIINMTPILIMSVNFADLGLPKIHQFSWNEGYDIIISAHDITTKF